MAPPDLLKSPQVPANDAERCPEAVEKILGEDGVWRIFQWRKARTHQELMGISDGDDFNDGKSDVS
jgi:hypothetical protein